MLSLVLLAFLSAGSAGGAELSCRDRVEPSGTCFAVHARLSAYNGNPSARLWVVGTNRLLGVPDGDKEAHRNLPLQLQRFVSFEVDMFGDFVVCPLTKDVPGAMRMVCVESVERLVVQKI